MKKILILTPIIPYPLSEGGIVSQYAFADYLRKKIKLIFLFILRRESHLKAVEELSKLWPDVDIYTINCIPQKINKPRFLKIYHKTKYLIYKFVDVLSNKSNTSINKNFNIANEDILNCVNFTEPLNKEYVEKINEIFENEKPDIIQIEHIGFLNLIFAINKGKKILTIFVNHEIFFARLENSGKIKNDHQSEEYFQYIYNLTKNIEKTMLKEYSAIFTFSDIDKQKLQNLLQKENIYTSPFPVLDEAFTSIKKEEFTIEKLIFVGSDVHTPNYDGLKWFIEEIFEKIYQKTQLNLEVIGKWTEENQKQFENYKHIKFLGFVEDLNKHSRNSILVVPIRVGSGIRTKILYSMAQLTPVVTTEVGIEGIQVEDNKEVMIAKDKNEFINKINYLFLNQEAAYQLAQHAQKFVKTNYTQEVLGNLRMKIYEKLLTK